MRLRIFLSLSLVALASALWASTNETELKIDSLLKVSSDPFAIDVTPYNNIGSIISTDGKLRILSWNLRNADGTFDYWTYFIYKKKGKAKGVVSKVVRQNAIKPSITGKYNANNWYGCLYYKAVAEKTGYILLGYQTYSDISRVKVIEPIEINGNNIVFGNDIFNIKGKKQSRVVFEYSANAVMNITYNQSTNSFVFDHLSPENPNLTGMFQYYGPDFTYDALSLKKKLWMLTEDLDIKNKN